MRIHGHGHGHDGWQRDGGEVSRYHKTRGGDEAERGHGGKVHRHRGHDHKHGGDGDGGASRVAKRGEDRVEIGVQADRASGAVRLLIAGHFKGSADIRLRINFGEEAQQAQNDAARPVAEDGIADLGTVAGDQLDKLLAEGGLTEAQAGVVNSLREGFDEKLADLKEGVASGDDLKTLPATLKGASDALLKSLEDLFKPATLAEEETETPGEAVPGTATQTPQAPAGAAVDVTATVTGDTQTPDAGETPPTTGTTPPATEETTPPATFDLGAYFAKFREAVANSLAKLTEALTDATTLPPLSPPGGNGASGNGYNKSLSIYLSLSIGGGTGTGATPTNLALDLVA